MRRSVTVEATVSAVGCTNPIVFTPWPGRSDHSGGTVMRAASGKLKPESRNASVLNASQRS
jgi:hypothetical protein